MKPLGYASQYPENDERVLCFYCGPNNEACISVPQVRSECHKEDTCCECGRTITDQTHDYESKNGYIISPGKFEHTPRYTPYFWGMVLDGDQDDHFVDSYGLKITSMDCEAFPELKKYRYVHIWENDQGFVHIDVHECMPDVCMDPDCGCDAVLNDECYQCGKTVDQVNDEAYEAYVDNYWDQVRKGEL